MNRPVTLATLLAEHYVDLDNIRAGHCVLVQRERRKMFNRLGLALWRYDEKRRKAWYLTALGEETLSKAPVTGRGVPQSYAVPSGYVASPKSPHRIDYQKRAMPFRRKAI